MSKVGNRVLKLLFLGSLSLLVGVLIFLLQLQIDLYALPLYIFIQSVLVVVFLLYFFFCGRFFSIKEYRRTNIFYFFVVPVSLFVFNLVFRKIIVIDTIVSIILLGIAAPFHYVLPYLYFAADKYFVVPSLFPVLICCVSFKIGENKSF